MRSSLLLQIASPVVPERQIEVRSLLSIEASWATTSDRRLVVKIESGRAFWGKAIGKKTRFRPKTGFFRAEG